MDSLWDETRAAWDRAASSVTRHRTWLEPPLQARRLWLMRGNVPMVITGRPGAGKSVLIDALTGRVQGLGYRTTVSPDCERHRVLLRGIGSRTRAALLVVPGQESAERTRSLAATFAGQQTQASSEWSRWLAATFRDRRAPVGVIHTVCWGYNELWSGAEDGAVLDLAPDATPAGSERVRQHLLEREAADFAELCGLLAAPSVQRRLRWLIIAVAKSDLFWSDLTAARDYYIPGAGGPATRFHDLLDKLTGGRRGFPPKLLIVPFSAHPVAHEYADGLYRRPSQLDKAQATALRDNFYDVLGGVL